MESEADFRRVSYPLAHGVVAGLEFGEATRPVDIVFLHATGLNARTYRTMLAPLASQFRIVALDLRGHGLTTLPARRWGYHSWARHRDDVIQVLASSMAAPVTLAGHSMGATTSLLIAGRRPDLVRGVCLIDPVILGGASYALMRLPGAPIVARYSFPIARGAARRRAAFESRAAAMQALSGRGFFKSFSSETLADYLADGAAESDGGGVRLTCAPAFEAATFAAQRNPVWRALARAPSPLVILRAGHGSTMSDAVARRVAAQRPDARIGVVEGASHALPMERPDRCRAAVEATAVLARRGGDARLLD